ncbi:MAG: hypothetical protein SGPRY_014947, partial [Prymnesium sp.]
SLKLCASAHSPLDVVALCMEALKHNNSPVPNAGKKLNWDFAGDMVRQIHAGNVSKFIHWSSNSP